MTRPDLINASFLFIDNVHKMRPWHPGSTEGVYVGDKKTTRPASSFTTSTSSSSTTSSSSSSSSSVLGGHKNDGGYVEHILPLRRSKVELYDPGSFKYLLVMTGD